MANFCCVDPLASKRGVGPPNRTRRGPRPQPHMSCLVGPRMPRPARLRKRPPRVLRVCAVPKRRLNTFNTPAGHRGRRCVPRGTSLRRLSIHERIAGGRRLVMITLGSVAAMPTSVGKSWTCLLVIDEADHCPGPPCPVQCPPQPMGTSIKCSARTVCTAPQQREQPSPRVRPPHHPANPAAGVGYAELTAGAAGRRYGRVPGQAANTPLTGFPGRFYIHKRLRNCGLR